MNVSGLCTSVPGTVRDGSAVADTPQSTQTVSCGLRQRLKQRLQPRVFSPSRVKRARARESPCPTPVVGRQRVTSGSGVTLSLRDRDCPTTHHPSQAKPSQAKPSQAKPSQAKPSQAKPSQAKPSQPLSSPSPSLPPPPPSWVALFHLFDPFGTDSEVDFNF